MRHVKEPEVYLVGVTSIDMGEMCRYLDDIGKPNWSPTQCWSDGLQASGAETLIEFAGRLCYRSWQAYDPNLPEATNPNVSKVREGNKAYIKNILDSRHGSVLEHCTATFVFKDVSRVLTHELVRHRAGMAYSQESLRYVRLTDLGFWLPPEIQKNDDAYDLFMETIEELERVQSLLSDMFHIDKEKNFHIKKALTSIFRRLAPLGLATSIVVTGNLRSWRHIIEQRTSEAAEEEIRLVIGKVAKILKDRFPAVFQDMSFVEDGIVFNNSKV